MEDERPDEEILNGVALRPRVSSETDTENRQYIYYKTRAM